MISENQQTVRFDVIEVLRGDTLLRELTIPGTISDNDDFNTAPVPYQMVRAGGQRGDCFATDYRAGAEYLLLLKRISGELSPYWQGLAPLNEQLRNSEDPWLAWVQDRIRS